MKSSGEDSRASSTTITRVLENPDEIVKQVIHLAETSKGLSIVSVSGGMELIYNSFFDLYRKILDDYRGGQGKGIKWVINMEGKESIDLVRKFVDLGMQIRHVKNLSSMNFAVGEKEVNATIEKMEGGKMVQSLLTSNEPMYIQHFYTIFEELWNKGIDAQDRIKAIEEGLESADIEIIPNPKEGIKHAWKVIKSARKEVLIIFSTANAFRRQIEMGGLALLKEVSKDLLGKVRILVPTDNKVVQTIGEVMETSPDINIRTIEESLQTRITIVLVDRKECVIVESIDDASNNSADAAGLATYSKSKSIVSSYVSIFESLWNQAELYEQLKESKSQLEHAYEKLKINGKRQKEFIDIAAHELRNPVQPILGLAEILRSKMKEEEQDFIKEKSVDDGNDIVDVIIRNAIRLKRLTEDILDITRIENQSLTLYKEEFCLNEVILHAIADTRNQFQKQQREIIKLILDSEPGKDDLTIAVVADKQRIIQVVSNLLNNAVKFTNQGVITIRTAKKNKDINIDGEEDEVIVSIRDTGTGIHPQILPKLFTKFVSASPKGTGLGLYICKSIVEAHGGKIWAQNNADGIGATFMFSLPMDKDL
jgi:two-component system sensor histidine kinase VicK